MTSGIFAVLLSFFLHINNMPPRGPSGRFTPAQGSSNDTVLPSRSAPVALVRNCCLRCAQRQHIDVYVAPLSPFQLFSSILTYYSGLVCAPSGPGSTRCRRCAHNNARCEQVPASLRARLNRLLIVSDAAAQASGERTTLIGLGRAFVGAVRRYRQLQRRNVAAGATSPSPVNPFGSHAEFSRLVVAIEGILDVLRYQVCWTSLVGMRRN